MSRYIDADLLKQCVQENITRYYTCGAGGYCLAEDVVEDIDNFPTADVVAVVRCKDCFYSEKTLSDECPKECSWCGKLCFITHEKHYCSYGERREENEE